MKTIYIPEGQSVSYEDLTIDRLVVLLYRTVRHNKDYTGGRNLYLTRRDLAEMSYPDLLFLLASLREEGVHERAA